MMTIRKIMPLVISIVLVLQLTVPVNTENYKANLMQEKRISCAQLDLDRMIAYVVSESAGFMVLDIKDPENPVPIAHLDLEDTETVTSMQIHDSVIYLTAGSKLQVVDVSDPYHPSGSYYTYVETGDDLAGLVICGSRAYLYDQHNIHVYSLDNPALPGFLKSYKVTVPDTYAGISGIAVHNGIVYAALGDDGIHIFDFTNLNDIRYAGKLEDVQGSCKKIVSYGDLIFVFFPEAGIVEVLNVSSGKSPKIAGNIPDFQSPWPDCGIQSDKNLLFLPEGTDKLHVVEAASQESVEQVGLAGLTVDPVCIGVKEENIYIIGTQCDICVLNTGNLPPPQPQNNTPVKKEEQNPPAEEQKSSADKRIAYITIDDGPSRNNTPKNLDTLKKYGIKATFFVLPKKNLDDIYRRILDEGHVIGNHSYVHDYNYLFSSADNFRNDVLKAQDFIYERFQYKSTVYRFPGGTMGRSKSVIKERSEILKELGYKYFDWDVSTADTDPNLSKIGNEGQIVSKLANNVIMGAKGRKKLIVLMHDSAGKTYTAKALPKIIEGLRKQGYVFDVLTNY